MENVIDLFMWGFQKHFQISLQVSAQMLFDTIDKRLNPTVFLLGVLKETRNDSHPICIEPEDCGYPVNVFAEVNKLAEELEKIDKEKNILHTLPIAQENHNKRISTNAQIDAIKKILEKVDLYSKTEKFISFPTYVEGYLVFVVLQIQKEALHNYYSLRKQMIFENTKISRSFIESAIDTFLKECTSALKDPNKSFGAAERQAEELLRESGKQFMYSISQAGKNFFGLHGLYDACNNIASLKYEGGEGLGRIIIAKKDHPNVRLTLELQEPIRIRDFRKVRKFLEISNANAVMISDSELIYGLGDQTGKYNAKEESLFVINFISQFKWEVLHDNNSMMVVEYKQPNLPKERMDRVKFYSDLKRIFKDILNSQLDNLWDVTNESTNQKHGTMLVISDNAKAEASRLGKQSFSLKPLKLTIGIVKRITSIDGAVLLDRNSDCHAIGVILDGLATDKGDSSRGARYNSAVRYYEHFGKNHPTLIVIISEDGMINLIPYLRPQINHSGILKEIEALNDFCESNKQDVKQFNKFISYFENISFYMAEAECNTVNQLLNTIEERNNENEIGMMRFLRGDFIPNMEMNESYYFD